MSAVFDNHAFMNVKQVAEYLHLNEKKVYALVNEGEIPATKVTGKWMFPRELVDRWMLDSSHGGLLADRLVIGGSDDPLLYRVLLKQAHESGNHALISYTPTGTRQGLDLLQSQRVNATALHWGPDTESMTRHPALISQFPQHPSWMLIHLFKREQGLMLSHEALNSLENEHELIQHRYRWAIRQNGSGAQRHLMETLARWGTVIDELNVGSTALSEREAAAAISMQQADVAPGAHSVASEYGLAFIPLGSVSVDLVLSKTVWFRHLFQKILKELKSVDTLKLADELGGYDLSSCGEMIWGHC